MTTQAPNFPASRRTAYQFPIYRWMGWLAVGGFAIGLTAMFFISGMFGIPAPIGWAALVILLSAGALLLDRPRLLLNTMLFYFLLVPNNRLFGLLWLPIPGSVNKLFFIPFIAVIVMNWIQRRQLKEATLFPLVFIILTGLSWYVNGRPSIFNTIQLTLVMMRTYILWYFCRLTCTFENERQLSRWVWGYVAYIAIQFFYNVLWQRAPWARFHPDHSGGVFGPEGAGAAHMVGYMSVFGLLLIAGWWVSAGHHARPRKRFLAALTALVIAYNLIFMTDTKHILVLFPLIAFPFFIHPSVSFRLKMSLLAAGSIFLIGVAVYFSTAVNMSRVLQYVDTIQTSPKGEMLYGVTVDLPYLARYPWLGTGPGTFCSPQAVEARTRLARQYIIPYRDEERRRTLFGVRGTTLTSSVIGGTQTDFFILMGEYGWLATAAYLGFWIWLIVRLLQKSKRLPSHRLLSGVYIALACCLLAQLFILGLVGMLLVPPLTYPIWILVGRAWDMRIEENKTVAPEEPNTVRPQRKFLGHTDAPAPQMLRA